MTREKLLPKKRLVQMTRAASLLHAKRRAQSDWEKLSWRERKKCFGLILDVVLREYAIGPDEWELYRSVLGTWLSRRSQAKRARLRAESDYKEALEGSASRIETETDTPKLVSVGDGYPCLDYQS